MDSPILLDTPDQDEYDEYINRNDEDIHGSEENLNHIMDTDDDDNQTALSTSCRPSYDAVEIHNIIGTSNTIPVAVPMQTHLEQPWSKDLRNGTTTTSDILNTTTAWTDSFDYNQIKTENFSYMDDYEGVQPAIANCEDEDSDISFNFMDIPFDTALAISSQPRAEPHEENDVPRTAIKEEAELNISSCYVEVEEIVHVADHQEFPCAEIKTEFTTESIAPDDEGEPLSPVVSEEHSAELESIMSDHNYYNQPDETEPTNSQPLSTSQDDMSLNQLLRLIQPKASALPQDGQLELLSLVTTLLTDEKLPIEVILDDIVRSANALKSQFQTDVPSERNDDENDEILEEQANPTVELNIQKHILPEIESIENDNISLIPQPECASSLPLQEEGVHSSNAEKEPRIASPVHSEDGSLYSEGHSEPAEYNPPAELLGTIPDDVVGESNVPPPTTPSQDDLMPSTGEAVVPVNPLFMCLEKLNMFGQNIVVRNSMLLRDMQTNCKTAKESTDTKLCTAFINCLDSDFKDLIKEFKTVMGLSKPVTVKVEKTAEEKAEAARKLNEKSKERWLASSSSDNDNVDQHNEDSLDSPVIMKRKRKRRRILSTESTEMLKLQETNCQQDIVPPVVQTPPADHVDQENCPSDELTGQFVCENFNDSNKEAIEEKTVEVNSKEIRTIEDINKDLGLNEDNGADIPPDSQASLDLSKYHASQFSTYESESSLPSPNPVEMNTYDEMEEDEFTVKNEYVEESQTILPKQVTEPNLAHEDSNAESVDYEPLSDDEFHGFDKDTPFEDNVKMELDVSAERIIEEDGNNNDDNLNSVADLAYDMNQEQDPINPNNEFGE